jgi:hypothetical protein
MPTTSPIIPPMPPPQVPLIDPATGLMTKVWFEYFRALDQSMRRVRAEIP